MKHKLPFLLSFLFLTNLSFAKIWQVGISRSYTAPSQVSSLVSNGDTVEIDAGIYNADVARWAANNLLIKGVGGMAHLKANGSAYGGKAIWVIAGNNTRIENIEFSLCAVPSLNGAGIRQEGSNLTVSHCYFHDNENGILAGTVNPSNIKIEYSEFANNGYGDGLSHNLYINNIDTLIFQYNYSHHAKIGHELKSRAHVNYILYNRISDETTGTASRNIDLPNGGSTYIIGNIIEQGPASPNSNLIGYGLEGLTNRAPHSLYAINNTLVNNKSTGSFFSFQTGTALFKGYNNIMAGAGSISSTSYPANVDTASNMVINNIGAFNFVNATTYDYHITSGSNLLLNKGTNPGLLSGNSLSPSKEYNHPKAAVSRCINGALDIGAHELCAGNGIQNKTVNKNLVYPNPATNSITIERIPQISYTITIYNLEGKSILTIDNAKVIDISNLPSGFYFLQCTDPNHQTTTKFLKL